MIVNIGRAVPGCLEAAAAACSVAVGLGDSAHANSGFQVPDALRSRAAMGRPDRVLQLEEDRAKTMSRKPSEAGVYIVDDDFMLAWDDEKDGYGLNCFLGAEGERITSAYASAMVEFYLGAPARRNLLIDGTFQMEYDMPQIRVTISPKAEIKIETTGFSGTSCQAATRDLEQALGLVESSEAKEEMYRTEERDTVPTSA